jgi:hypothetical protein
MRSDRIVILLYVCQTAWLAAMGHLRQMVALRDGRCDDICKN